MISFSKLFKKSTAISWERTPVEAALVDGDCVVEFGIEWERDRDKGEEGEGIEGREGRGGGGREGVLVFVVLRLVEVVVVLAVVKDVVWCLGSKFVNLDCVEGDLSRGGGDSSEKWGLIHVNIHHEIHQRVFDSIGEIKITEKERQKSREA
jgi:hypothetical protein